MEQSLKPTTLRGRIATEFIHGVRRAVWSDAAGLAFADRILAMVGKPEDPGYRDDVLRTKGAWFIPGTLILLGWEWSWTDTWLTPHLGFTTFKNYQTLRVGWLALALGIAWPTKRAVQQAGMLGNYGRDMAQTDRHGRTCPEERAYLVEGEWHYKGRQLYFAPVDLSDQDRDDIIRALEQARSALGDLPFYQRATQLAARLKDNDAKAQ